MLKLIAKLSIIHDMILKSLEDFSGLAALAIRLFLVPVFWMAGSHKIDFDTLMPYESTVQWFGNPDWGLGLPAPELWLFLQVGQKFLVLFYWRLVWRLVLLRFLCCSP